MEEEYISSYYGDTSESVAIPDPPEERMQPPHANKPGATIPVLCGDIVEHNPSDQVFTVKSSNTLLFPIKKRIPQPKKLDPVVSWQGNDFKLSEELESKLAWANPVPSKIEYTDDSLSCYELINEFRFDMEGSLCFPIDTRENTSLLDKPVLRHHSERPELEGYTISESLTYASSTNSAQSRIGLRILAETLKNRHYRLSEETINRSTSNIEAYEKVRSKITPGARAWGLGANIMDNFLFNSVAIQDKLMNILVQTKSFQTACEIIIVLANLFNLSECQCISNRLLVQNEHPSKLTSMDPIPSESNQHDSWIKYCFFDTYQIKDLLKVRRSLIRSDEVTKVITTGSNFDISNELMYILAAGFGEGDHDTEIFPLDVRAALKDDPLLSLMFWKTDKSLFSLIRVVAQIVEKAEDYESLGASFWLLTQLCFHSEFVCSIVVDQLKILSTKQFILILAMDRLIASADFSAVNFLDTLLILLFFLKVVIVSADDTVLSTAILRSTQLAALVNKCVFESPNHSVYILALQFKLLVNEYIDSGNPFVSVLANISESPELIARTIPFLLLAHETLYRYERDCSNGSCGADTFSSLLSLTNFLVHNYEFAIETYLRYYRLFLLIDSCVKIKSLVDSSYTKIAADLHRAQVHFETESNEVNGRYVNLSLIPAQSDPLMGRTATDEQIFAMMQYRDELVQRCQVEHISGSNKIQILLSDNHAHITPPIHTNVLAEILESQSHDVKNLALATRTVTALNIIKHYFDADYLEPFRYLLVGEVYDPENNIQTDSAVSTNPYTLLLNSNFPYALLSYEIVINDHDLQFCKNWIEFQSTHSNSIAHEINVLLNVCRMFVRNELIAGTDTCVDIFDRIEPIFTEELPDITLSRCAKGVYEKFVELVVPAIFASRTLMRIPQLLFVAVIFTLHDTATIQLDEMDCAQIQDALTAAAVSSPRFENFFSELLDLINNGNSINNPRNR